MRSGNKLRSQQRAESVGNRSKQVGHRQVRGAWNRLLPWLRFEQLEDRSMLALGDQTETPPITGDPHSHDADEMVSYLPPQHSAFTLGGYLTTPSQAPPLEIALEYLRQHAVEWGLSTDVFAQPIVTDLYTSEGSGTTHIYLRQQFNGLEVANANINANVDSLGRLINIGGGFAPAELRSDNKAGGSQSLPPVIDAIAAIEFAAEHLGYTLTVSPTATAGLAEDTATLVFVSSEVSRDPIPVQQKYVATPEGLGLAWDMVLRTPDGDHWYNVSIDAYSGELLLEYDWVSHASYNVFPAPLESPSDGPRSIVVDPQDSLASPFGWHDTNGVVGAEFTDTRGNNVSAQDDIDANDTGGSRANGGGTLTFDFPLNLGLSPAGYRDAAITNLFYWNNILHDIHYRYGFTEAAGNFQVNNYGRGGLGSDAVQADAQDGEFLNNANFGTPPDGTAPRMQMFIFDAATPDRDGDLDNGVIVHEYGHGVSTRLTGGPANSNSLDAIQSGGLGEGYGDFWALMLTQKPTDVQNAAYPIGTYLENQPPTGSGIRLFPYSFNMTTNPTTFADYNVSNEVHDSGEIWASALWDLNWLLINKLGYNSNLYAPFNTGGNNLTLQLVMDGLKLQPSNPTFLDGRDAILLADQVLTGGANQVEIWTAFARRGMGASASDGGSSNATTVTEAFDIPPATPAVSVVASPSSVLEDGTQNVVFAIRRIGLNLSAPTTVSFTVGGTATFTADYDASSTDTPFTFNGTSGTVTIAAGQTTARITLNPVGDTADEPDETAILTVTTGTGYTVGSANVATGTIISDDNNVTVAVSPLGVLEAGAPNLLYTFTRSGNLAYPQSVNFSVSGTAAFGPDYSQSGATTFGAGAGSVAFAAGNATAVVTINPTPDAFVEPSETVVLTVTPATVPPAVTTEAEPNNSLAAAQNIDTANWTTNFSPNIGDATSNTSTSIHHVTITGTGNNTFDYYAFTVARAGDRGIFDTDFTSFGFDTELFLYNNAGVLLASSDDSETTEGDGGSTSFFDSFIDFEFTAPGRYIIGVGQFNSFGDPGGITGTTPSPGDAYTLQVSLTNHLGPTYTIGTPGSATGTISNGDVDLQVSISDAPDPVVPGSGPGNLVYTVNVSNLSTVDTAGVVVSLANVLPAGVTFVSAVGPGTNSLDGIGTDTWNAGTIVAGGTATLTVTYTVGGSAVSGNTVSLTATVTGATQPLINLANDTDTEISTLAFRTDLTVTQTESSNSIVAGGPGFLTYVVSVTNNGPSNATGVDVTEDLDLPAGVTISSITPSVGSYATTTSPDGIWTFDLAVGQTETLTVVLLVGAAAPVGIDIISSTPAITGGAGEFLNPVDDFAFDSTSVTRLVDLVVTQSDSLDPIVAGSGEGNLVYVVTVTNAGPSDASGVILTESLVLPAGVVLVSAVPDQGSYTPTSAVDGTWDVGTIPSGESATLTINVTVRSSTVPGSDVISATSTVFTTNEPLQFPADDTSTTTTSVTREVDLVVSKNASSDPIFAGSGVGNLVITVFVGNEGPSDATGVELFADLALPAGVTLVSITPSVGTTFNPALGPDGTWTVGSLPGFNVASLTFVMTVDSSANDGDIIRSDVFLTAVNEPQTDISNDSRLDIVTVREQIDLIVSQTESISTVVAGSGANNLTYVVTVTNAGPAIASGVVLSENLTLPTGVVLNSVTPSAGTTFTPLAEDGTWTVGGLLPGESATLTVVLTVGASAASGTNVIVSTATVTAASETRINLGNDANTEATSVQRQIDLEVSQTESIDAVVAGSGLGNLTYVLTVQNNGPSHASGVLLLEDLTLPAGVSVVSITPSASTTFVTTTTPDGTWNVGNLNSGASATLTIVVTASASTAAGTDVVRSSAIVSASNEAIVNPGDDAVDTRTSVARQVDLVVTQTESSDIVVAGSGTGNLTYVVRLANNGPSNASNIVVNDVVTLPANVSVVSRTPSVGSTFSSITSSNGTWTVNNLAPGEFATLTLVLTAQAGAAEGAVVSNTATITAANETRVNTADDFRTESSTVIRQIDLRVVQTDSPDPLFASATGTPLTYVATVTNLGPSNASSITLLEQLTLPVGVNLNSITPSGSTTFVLTNILEGVWSLGSLAVGESATLTVVVSADLSTTNGQLTSNTVQVTSADATLVNPGDDISVENTTVLVADFGDAPLPFPTGQSANGARHIATGATLGATRDAEGDGQPSTSANGDDLDTSDDEDGLIAQSILKPNNAGSLTVDLRGVAGTVFVNAWIDFNRNGSWADFGEQVAIDVPFTSNGAKVLEFLTPALAAAGPSVARLRVSTATGLSFSGLAPDGEVEDHAVNIVGPGNVTATIVPDPANPRKQKLIITGDDQFNEIAIELGTRNGVPQKNALRITGLDGTTVNGQASPGEFVGINLGFDVELLDGNDVVIVTGQGVAGPFTLYGGLGDDTYSITTAKARFVLVDTGGLDTLDFSGATKSAKVDLAKQIGQSQALGNGNSAKLNGIFENVVGSEFNDTFKGNSANNKIDGRGGNDKLDGRGGNDILLGGEGNDSVLAGPGVDVLLGGFGIDSLVAGPEGNTLSIGGYTPFDATDSALLAILGEWTRRTGQNLATLDSRRDNLVIHGVGLNNAIKLAAGNVLDDILGDTLKSAVGGNLFFASPGDKVVNRKPGDSVQP